MHRYVVISAKVETDELQRLFPETYPLKEGNAWMIGTSMNTSADVSKSLGFTSQEGDKARSGIVVKVDEYYGFYDKSLWQKLDAWKKS